MANNPRFIGNQGRQNSGYGQVPVGNLHGFDYRHSVRFRARERRRFRYPPQVVDQGAVFTGLQGEPQRVAAATEGPFHTFGQADMNLVRQWARQLGRGTISQFTVGLQTIGYNLRNLMNAIPDNMSVLLNVGNQTYITVNQANRVAFFNRLANTVYDIIRGQNFDDDYKAGSDYVFAEAVSQAGMITVMNAEQAKLNRLRVIRGGPPPNYNFVAGPQNPLFHPPQPPQDSDDDDATSITSSQYSRISSQYSRASRVSSEYSRANSRVSSQYSRAQYNNALSSQGTFGGLSSINSAGGSGVVFGNASDFKDPDAGSSQGTFGGLSSINSAGRGSSSSSHRRGYRNQHGGWFAYAHTIKGLDLERYQIYENGVSQPFEVPCIVHALEMAGAESKVCEYVRSIVAMQTHDFPMRSLDHVARLMGLHIVLRTDRMATEGNKMTMRTLHYPSDYKRNPKCKYAKPLHLALLDGHYFVFDAQVPDVSPWALRRGQQAMRKLMTKRKAVRNSAWYQLQEKPYRPTFFNSFRLVQMLLDRREHYLVELTRSEDMLEQMGRWGNLRLHYPTLEYDSEVFTAPYGTRPDFEEHDFQESIENGYKKLERLKTKEPFHAPTNKKKFMVFAFDFETTTDGEYHRAYLCSARRVRYDEQEDLQEEVKTFIGEDCGKQLIQWVGRTWVKEQKTHSKGVLLIAHNASYDFRFIMKYVSPNYAPKYTASGNRLKSFKSRFVYDEGRNTRARLRRKKSGKKRKWANQRLAGEVDITVHDTMNFTACRLSQYPKMFKLKCNIRKEIMPYSLYNEVTIFSDRYELQPTVPVEEAVRVVRADEADNPKADYCIRTGFQDNTQADKRRALDDKEHQFRQNLKDWNCLLNDGKDMDLIEYARVYCEMDVEILAQGYRRLREMFMKVTNGLSIDFCVSVNQLTNEALVREGCTDGVYELSGVPRDFIQNCVAGGKCMMRENTKQKVLGKRLADFDATSLYPSAMREMLGFLRGIPKPLPANTTYEEAERLTERGRIGMWFAKCRVSDIETRWELPIPNYYDEKRSCRTFSNDPEGKDLWITSVAAQDITRMQGGKVEIVQGYYFDQGYNNKISEFVYKIFTERLKMKRDKNPMQLVYKLMMNGLYGRLILKPVESSMIFVKEADFTRKIERDWNLIKTVQGLEPGSPFAFVFEVRKSIKHHWTAPHVGSAILDHSKRIMNRVIEVAHDTNSPIYYMDTDSMHLQAEHLPIVQREFRNKYSESKLVTLNGGELIGKNLGQFHSDFSAKAVGYKKVPEFKRGTELESSAFIVWAKKSYLHLLTATTENGEEWKGFAVGIKGVTEEGLYKAANTLNISLWELFEKVYNGEEVEADLLAGGRVSFSMEKNFMVSSRGNQTRTLRATRN